MSQMGSFSFSLGQLVGALALTAAVLGVIVFAVLSFVRSSGARAIVAGTRVISVSPDGRFWWDGSKWQDINAIAPGDAPRSPDGNFWWDGQTWRPVPRMR